MISRRLVAPPDEQWFNNWRTRAQTALTAVVRAHRSKRPGEKISYEYNSKIWGDLKDHLKEIFHGKCAFCDSQITVVDFGHVDHYRPKSAVEGVPDHDGYYWLAYELSNYLLCCAICNTSGKRTKFPVEDERRRAYKPDDDLALEGALLLNPYAQDPSQHLRYDRGTGEVVAKTGSKQGAATIDVCDLNRKELREARMKAQRSFPLVLGGLVSTENHEELRQLLEDVLETGKAPYAAALVDIAKPVAAAFGDFIEEQESESVAADVIEAS